jgi:diguanylate cyclase (GGDEF)-like protein
MNDLSSLVGDPRLDCIAALARQAFDVPYAMIAVADGPTLMLRGVSGTNRRIVDRAGSFCDLALAARETVILADTMLDTRITPRRGPDGQPIRFFAGVPLAPTAAGHNAVFYLLDTRPRALAPEQTRHLTDIAEVVTALLREQAEADAAADKAQLAREQALTARYKSMYDRSSALAKIGVWQCDLATSELTWTDGVYDLFELPRSSPLRRLDTVALYEEESRREMERLRAHAIATRTGFSLDAQIRTVTGQRRWMRLTADVECEDGVPIRIFGSKQDITDEKNRWHRMQALAERDALTGLANRSVFQTRFAPGGEPPAALLLIDLDGFKQVNDSFGHAAGDECLKQSGMRLRRAWPDAQLIARIGGDEFAVLLDGAHDRDSIEAGIHTLLRAFRRPVSWHGQGLELSASIGVAMPGETGDYDPARLFAEADTALYAAKAGGRGTFRMFERGDIGATALQGPPFVPQPRTVAGHPALGG